MKVKRILLATICGMVACVPIHAQKVTYSYDAGGNRTLKKVVIISAGAKAQGRMFEEDEEATAVTDVFSQEEGISISATDDGRVTINISDTEWTGEATITAYASNGGQVTNERTTTRETQIDLSSKPAGMYILTIKTGRRTKTWKLLVR